MVVKDRSVQETADFFGVSASYIYYILRGKKTPGRKLLAKMRTAGIDPTPYLEVSPCNQV